MAPSLTLLLGLAVLAGSAASPGGKPLPAGPGRAVPAPVPATVVDDDTCVYQGRTFRLSLRRAPGVEPPDDLLLTLDQGSRSVEARRLNESAVRWWKLAAPAAGPGWKPAGVCKRVEAVPAKVGRILLLVLADGRPGADHLFGIIYDALAQRVVDTRDLGPAGRLLAFVDGELHLRQGELGETGGGMDTDETGGTALPGGERLVAISSAFRPLNPVLHVGTSGNRIDARPDLADTWREVTAEAPEMARAFSGPAAFGAAFGWGTKAQASGYRTGRTAKGADCVRPLRSGEIDGQVAPWHCGAPPR